MKSELQSNTEPVVDLAAELRRIHQTLLLLEARIDEEKSRINGLAALLQQQVQDMKVILEGYETLSQAVKGHHTLLQSLTLALPPLRQPTTLQ